MDMIATRIKNRLRSNWIELRPVRATKVVGIGLPKTGTTSLGHCFRRFGFEYFGDRVGKDLLVVSSEKGRWLGGVEPLPQQARAR